jgi:anti-sigma B factor antagonist
MAKGGAMTVEQQRISRGTVVLILSGRLDAANAPLLEQKIKQWGSDITEIVLDFAGLTYISSMGLRVILHAKKNFRMGNRKLTIKNMNESVREVFEMTGFLNLMVQEEQFVLIRKDEPGEIILSFNGQMQLDNIVMVSKELTKIKQDCLLGEDPLTVILDMENLVLMPPSVCKFLKETIDQTACPKRTVKIRNIPLDIKPYLEKVGLGELFAFFWFSQLVRL